MADFTSALAFGGNGHFLYGVLNFGTVCRFLILDLVGNRRVVCWFTLRERSSSRIGKGLFGLFRSGVRMG